MTDLSFRLSWKVWRLNGLKNILWILRPFERSIWKKSHNIFKSIAFVRWSCHPSPSAWSTAYLRLIDFKVKGFLHENRKHFWVTSPHLSPMSIKLYLVWTSCRPMKFSSRSKAFVFCFRPSMYFIRTYWTTSRHWSMIISIHKHLATIVISQKFTHSVQTFPCCY